MLAASNFNCDLVLYESKNGKGVISIKALSVLYLAHDIKRSRVTLTNYANRILYYSLLDYIYLISEYTMCTDCFTIILGKQYV